MKTPITELLGCEFPILAFSHCRDVVAAVSRAGGFGVLGAVAHSPEQLEIDLAWIDAEVGSRPYGVDLLLPQSTLVPQKAVSIETNYANCFRPHIRRSSTTSCSVSVSPISPKVSDRVA